MVFVSVFVVALPTLLVRGCTIQAPDFDQPRGSVIKVFNHQSQKLQSMELEEYVKGVVAAEMPATFEQESLKAQAVLARTYVLRRVRRGLSISEHPEAVISTDFQSGQAWVSKQELQSRWGMLEYLFNWNKISRAVEATAGQVLVYDGEFIEALYHSNAGGQTEDASNVWGNPVPYLKSVLSEYDVEGTNYRQEFSFTWDELDQLLGTNLVKIIQDSSGTEMENTLTQMDGGLIEILEVSSANRILQLRIDGCVFTGLELRNNLGLPSLRAEIRAVTGGLKFITYGNGHGVGLSQYGANGMAKAGYSYQQILEHYYPGAQLRKVKGN